MALAPGTRLGPYEVTAQIGAGGMGEVYRARDTKLARHVALKILPEAFAQDAERLARFRREAQVLASLNHPNIAHIHGLEDDPSTSSGQGGVHALVMELVEGPTLAERIACGPIAVDDALPIARQIAEALEAAHEQGIVHRDLKPANIKVRNDGTVKVLDFGLAKAMEPAAASGDAPNSPTITSPAMTQRGVILGTAAYMSPEQARGKTVDRRSDIWAFGCVLYEMLTGRRAFHGEDVSDTLAAILRAEVDWSLLPDDVPPTVRTFLGRCLSKNLRQRVADMQDLRLALEGAFEPANRLIVPLPGPRWSRHVLPVAAATFVAGVLIAWTVAWMLAPQTPATVSRFRYVLAPDQTLRRSGNLPMAVSPDGRSFVYNTTQGVFVRTIGELDARLISGTQEDLANVEFSPDGRFISFVSATGELKRIAISGGVAVRIASVASARGIHWAADGTILLAQPEGIVQVSSNGGKPTLVIPAVEREQLRAPQLLPDVRTVLFTTGTDSVRSVVAQSISSGERTIVVAEGDWARYVPPNYLVYTLRGTLFGVMFDPKTLRVTGTAMPIQQGVPLPGGYAVSPNGTFAYISGASVSRGTPVVVDRKGTILQRLSPTPLDAPRHPAFDPTGQRIAIVVGPRGRSRLWLYFLDGRPPVPATSVGDGDVPVWSPTADRLALGYSNEGRRFVYFIPANGIAGPPEPFFAAPDDVDPQAWSPDGREIVVMRRLGRPVQTDLLAVSVDSSEKVRLLAASQKINEYHGRLSPNGRWLAHGVWYEGIGSLEIHVRPYSSDGRSIRVAADNGNLPLWSRDGTELFYMRRGQMMSIPVSTTGPEFSFGSPTLLFEGKFQFASFLPAEPDRSNLHTYYDVDAKGRFVLIEPEADPLPNEIVVVLNWQEELKRLLSTN